MDTFTYTAVCPDCGVILRVPIFFWSTELKCLLGLMAALLEFILILVATHIKDSVKWFVIGQILVIALTVLIIRTVSAIILSLGKWEEQQAMSDVLLRYYNDPAGHKQRTYSIAMSGLILAMMCMYGCYVYIFTSAMMAVFNILIGVIAKEKNNIKVGLWIVLGAAILLISCYVLRPNVAMDIMAGIGFALSFLGLYFLSKVIDKRKKKTKYS